MNDNAEEEERHVRNMNLFVAFGAAELGRATLDTHLLETARQSMRSDIWERDNGNRGYLGRLDRLWTSRAREADRIENRAASIALLLAAMAPVLGDPKIARHAETVWRDWATCHQKRCKTAGCKYWAGNAAQCQMAAAAAQCAFRGRDRLARQQCETLIALQPAATACGPSV